MITQEEGKGFSSSTKQESNNKNITNFIVSSRPSSSSTISSSSWSRSKDLRVVRVSKALGGKDRHSKVCTVRGLKDRRVRLSVETAIQLYDLQERLGLNQPSKVVDWLLNQAKQEIDELPPLQIPPPGLNFPQNLHYSMIMSANSTSASSSSNHQVAVDRAKEIKDEKSRNEMDNLNLESRHHHQRSGYASLLSTSDLLQKPSNINPSRVQFLMNRNSLDNSSLLRWDPSNLSLSHHHHHHQPEDNDDHQHFQNFNNNCVVPLQPSTFNDSTPSGPHLGVPHYPSQSYFDLQMLSSNSHNSLSSNSLSQSHVESSTYHQQEVPPPVRPFRLANFLCSASDLNIGNEANKDDGHD